MQYTIMLHARIDFDHELSDEDEARMREHFRLAADETGAYSITVDLDKEL